MDELAQLAADALEIARTGARGALCTIVRASGSVFRSAGARMLVSDDGTVFGHLSGGCLEADVAEHAKNVMVAGAPRVVVYRPEDQVAVFGVQSGCKGDLAILIEPLTPELNEELQRSVALRPFGRVTVVSRFAEEDVASGTRFLAGDDAASMSGDDEGAEDVFRQKIEPGVSLLIFGAGPVALPLTRIAKTLGWRVVIADHRAAVATRERFPDADEIVIAPAESLVDTVRFGARPVALVMAHQWDFDRTMLHDLLPRNLEYLGLLGSAARRDRLVAEWSAPGTPDPSIEKLRAPAGLALGGETPAEVALSMAAEIQAVLHGEEAIPLRRRNGRIHDRDRVAAIVLAAGASRRYGEAKQLAPFEGEPLIRRVVRTARAARVTRVFVVVGAAGDQVRDALAGLDAEIVVNGEWASGMASSIRAGIAAAEGFDGYLLLLGDQPIVDAGELDRILEARRTTGRTIVASRYPEGAGVPALFDRTLAAELLGLEGDHGAREVIRRRMAEVALVDSSTFDVDRPEDLIGCLKR